MNIEYLTQEILPIREQEIKEGKNLGTRNPIYVVIDLREFVTDGHSNYLSHTTNLKGKTVEYGYVDMALNGEEREFRHDMHDMINPEALTRFWIDDIKAFFLTSEAAHDYLKYQSHNLSKHAYVYVFCSGYGNKQMDKLFKAETL